MAVLGSDAAETEIFYFDVFIHAVLGAFAAEARFFYAPEGCDLGGNDSGVDADDAVFESFGDAPDAGDVAAVKISGETEFRIVREGDGVRFCLETKEGRYGSKGFFARDGHLRRYIGENRRLKKTAAESVTVPTDKNLCTFGLRVADVTFHFFDGRVVNQWTLRRACFQSWRGLQLLYSSGQFFSEHLVDGVLHEQTVRAVAGLSRVAVLRSDGAFDGGIQIRVFKNNKWSVASEFEGKFFYRAGALGHQDFADFRGAGERELSDDRIGREFRTDLRRRAGNNIQHSFGNAGAFGKLS